MNSEEGVLTAMILATPNREERMPDASTRRHRGRPKFSMLVASLFRFPSMFIPKTNIAIPRNTNPDSELRSGQLRAKYFGKRVSSETMRNMLIELVMKCDTPSKKKNYENISGVVSLG